MTEPHILVRIRSIHWEATDVCSFVLEAHAGTALQLFDPGAHIDLKLPNGLMRSYSLSHQRDDGRYRITVARDPNSSGGSALLTEHLRPGDTFVITDARNTFPLFEGAPLSVFIAGGIGITPFVSMIQQLNAGGHTWRLHYCVRTRDRAALLGELETLASVGDGEVVLNIDQEPGGITLDLPEVINMLGTADHVYCCGPTGMLDAFRGACQAAAIPDERIHYEYFKSNVAAASEGGFDLVLARAGKTIRVAEGQTILQTLLAHGFDIPFSCEEGVCGSCETGVLAGEPEHRDLILTEAERAAGRTMMVCCSGSKSAKLTLDI